MSNKIFPKSQLPIRRTIELLPSVFQTDTNDKFLSSTLDALTQPGVLEKTVGYVGRRYGKTYKGNDIYLDDDETLRSRYQLEPAVVIKEQGRISKFYDYIDFKNQIKFFGNDYERDDKITEQSSYSWNPPIDWDKLINYREYYWEPLCPPAVKIQGQSINVNSKYTVRLGQGSTYVFSPDSFTNNPTITLYRGQQYEFKVNAPYDGLIIRTNYDTGSLLYNPVLPYPQGALVVYDNKLWRARVPIAADGSSISPESQDWEFVDDVAGTSALNYNNGVTNNGVENGILIFQVPYDAPDILFYQSKVDPNRFGKIIVADIEENTRINVDLEIIGKQNYTSSNNITFTNGLVVEFIGKVTPSIYSSGSWLVEGVGKKITLTNIQDLVPTDFNRNSEEVLFDREGFDTVPFDDASLYAGSKDYITITKSAKDQNPWSRSNRWFHRSVLEFAYKNRGQDFLATESRRASRPIIEFVNDIQLYNHGIRSKAAVDFIDNFTTDVFSIIEGSLGYSVENEPLFDGARLLITADTDELVNNKIFTVKFIKHNNRRQISLVETVDSDPIKGESVLIKRGKDSLLGGNRGLMYHFDGSVWIKSQRKTQINQTPLFDVFDDNGISYGNLDIYPTSTFQGCKLFSYKIGTGVNDKELGFPLSYLNIDNIGDIQFNWDWEIDAFAYTIDRIKYEKNISTGFYKSSNDEQYYNGWIALDKKFLQPIIDNQVINQKTNTVSFFTVDWKIFDEENSLLNFYVNGYHYKTPFTRNGSVFTFEKDFQINDSVTIKIITSQNPDRGYYEIPIGLEKNPLNQNLSSFTLGQAVDHLSTALEFNEEFEGSVVGVSNLRDINDYQNKAKRFLKHSVPSVLSLLLLCDKDVNVIKSLQYAKKSYSQFKNSFLTLATELAFIDSPADFVDKIIEEWTRSKTALSPFSASDMIGNGAYTGLVYTVEDTGITTFALSQKFSLNQLSKKAVYVYLNQKQLLHGRDYVFDTTFGFVKILVNVELNDKLEIREYISTSFNYIPATPTSLGMYKKYIPEMYIDDSYVTPKKVIRGHDGSLIDAFNDYRDDIILELEFRIYNNIKKEYDTGIIDIDKIFGGYYGQADFSKADLDLIVSQEFLKWVQNTNINYIDNGFYDSQDPWTYTYNRMTDPTGNIRLPGYWRAVYKWFYDTDRPDVRPWEMLGFTIKPNWWDDQYGVAPYTSQNLLLWEDLRDGIIRQGTRAGTYDRYKRPSLLNHLPVDDNGDLLDPLASNLATNFSLVNNTGPFQLGDEGPVEHAWKVTSEYPFAICIALSLYKPFEFIARNFNLANLKFNKLNQIVSKFSNYFTSLDDLVNFNNTDIQLGLIQYLNAYLLSKNLSTTEIKNKISSVDISLSHRLSGFVDKSQQKYLLDSKSPKSQSSAIFIPQENYDVIFNVSSPIFTISYSGVIIEKSTTGLIIKGYDDIRPYFSYYEAVPNQKDPLIQVGGVSETFVDWEPSTFYNNGQLIRIRVEFYRAIKSHTSAEEIDYTLYKKVPGIPLIGSVEALKRRTFNTLQVKKLYYGTVFTTIQEVVDFLLGYEHWLKEQGFVFNDYNKSLGTTYDWTTSCKEFMFWTKQNWSDGALLAVSPISQKIEINLDIGVVDNLLDTFYEYRVLRDDGNLLNPEFINVKRSFQNFVVTTNSDTNDGIFFLRVHFVLKEHVTIFNDRTVFNDLIFNKVTGYRQERIKVQGFRTVDWDGDYTSPGFVFDNVNIEPWQQFKDYKLGDIVNYRSINWTSLENQIAAEIFDETKWTKLDSTPEKSLVANFDYKINLIEDYYEVDSEGLGFSQRMLARHAIGYQTRDYLQNLSEDQITQFRIYQGFIKEKGSKNSISKVFDKLSRSGSDSVTLNEEWAFRVGKLGGVDQYSEIELDLRKDQFVINPQPIIVTQSKPTVVTDQYYYISQPDFSIYNNLTFDVNINATAYDAEPYKVAGYVKNDQIEHTLTTKDDLLNYDINLVKENDHIWITFEKTSWNVYRYNEEPLLTIENVSTLEQTVTLTLSRRHQLQVGDIIGINVENLTGFYKIDAVSIDESSLNDIQVTKNSTDLEPILDISKVNNLRILTPARFAAYEDLNEESAALLANNSKLWVDNNGENHWEVINKKKQFSAKTIFETGISVPSKLGTKVIYSESLQWSFVSDPDSAVVVIYSESNSLLNVKQIIVPPSSVTEVNLQNSFGEKMSLSPDNRFLIVGAPLASGIASTFKGDLDQFLYNDNDNNYNNPPPAFTLKNIAPNDIFLYRGKLWRSKVFQQLLFDGSTKIDVYSENWEPAESIPANATGSNPGYRNQGAIFIYELIGEQYEYRETILSPRMHEDEKFGSEIAIGVTDTDYYMAISAIGSQRNTGRVYLYNFVQNENAVQTFPGILINNITNTIDFNDAHNYFTGQRVYYVNGNIDGKFISTQDQPPPPEDNTEFWIIAIDRFRIQLATSVQDARDSIPISLSEIGIDDSSYHTLIREVRQSGWRHLENHNYRGIYGEIPRNPTYGTLSLQPAFYPAGSIVWSNGKLWEAQVDHFEDGSSLSVDSQEWLEVSDISTQNSLPLNLNLGNDHSTLDLGLLSEMQIAELVKDGDQFGQTLAMSRDGSILAVGAPISDGQFFVNYKGIWRSDIEYVEDDVVKYYDSEDENSWGYYKLVDNRPIQTIDSTVKSYGIQPGNYNGEEFVWNRVGDSTDQPVGKVYIYQRNNAGVYRLRQTITADNLSNINDIVENVFLNVGDEFGHALDLDASGNKLVVASPKADKNYINQGSVYVFELSNDIYKASELIQGKEYVITSVGTTDFTLLGATENTVGVRFYASKIGTGTGTAKVYLEYRLKQRLESYEKYTNEYFGQDVKINPLTDSIVVSAKNSRRALTTLFNQYAEYEDVRPINGNYALYVAANDTLAYTATTFDQGKTTFADQPGFVGGVYVFELKDQRYFLTEKLDAIFSPNESFGHSIDVGSTRIIVGSPGFISPAPHNAVLSYDGPVTGTARLFYKPENVSSWDILSTQQPVVDISKIKNITLVNAETYEKIQDIDFIDPAKFKILDIAEQEIKFKTSYDPAIYNIGTEQQVVDSSIAWTNTHVGEVWWDVSKVKWTYYEQGDISYRLGNWAELAEGSEISVYEWVESVLLPSEWSIIADTNEGLAEGISGQPLYPDDTVYTVKELFNINTGENTATLYYYWVKNKVTVPNIKNRKLSVSSITSTILNPKGTGQPFLVFSSANSLFAHNFNSIISQDKFFLNILRYKNNLNANEVHNEYILLAEEVEDSIPNAKIETKWIDSLVGYDVVGKKVPDPTLNNKQKYGLEFRPRQTMFVNRLQALKIAVNRINSVLQTEPFSDILDFTILNSADEAPDEILKEYDQIVETIEDLELVGTARVRPAALKANIVDGAITSISIIDGGFGYRSKELLSTSPLRYRGPTIEIEGDGLGAKASVLIDGQGIVVDTNIESSGKKYSTAIAKIRNFSVLVQSDSTLAGSWSIYSWDTDRKVFFKTRSQAFNTKKYWSFVNWWKFGYSEDSRILTEIPNVAEEAKVSIQQGDLIRVKEYGAGGWAVFEKTNSTSVDFLDRYSIVGRENGTIAFSESLYDPTIDGLGYDSNGTFDTTFFDIDNSKELRNIFKATKENIFINVYKIEWNRLFFSSMKYVLSEQVFVDWMFKTSFLKATHNVGELQEKFNYKNDNLESFKNYIDEVKPYRTTVREYVSRYNKLESYNNAAIDFDLPSVYSKTEGRFVTALEDQSLFDKYPWKYFNEVKGFSIISIEIYDSGSEYTSAPKVLIDGNGEGATARAFVSNGQVSGIVVLTEGSGYINPPTITLVGGTNGSSAKAVAILGNSKVRTFNLTVKFDRISKESNVTNFDYEQTFIATGSNSTFNLSYPPSREKNKVTVYKNGQLILASDYNISFFVSTVDTYDLLKARLVLNSLPAEGDIISVSFEKNVEILDAVGRINKSYSPSVGMKNKDLGQLMTGIDFGGVQIQGTTFDVTGGWDALPWYTDNWDSVEAAADYYYICDGSTSEVELPYIPAEGQIINIYLKKAGSFAQGSIDTNELTGQVTLNSAISAPSIIRIDDPNYSDLWDSAVVTNPNAQMPTFVGDGSNKIITIGQYIQTDSGDILIFRPIESDGSVTITDSNLLDTLMSGGSLENTGTNVRISNNTVNGIYTTARGILAEDIAIEGGPLISPDQVPAPEENLPGQVIDSFSIRVFHTSNSGTASLNTRVLYGDGVTKVFDIGSTIVNSKNIIVYVDKVLCLFNPLADSTIFYNLDLRVNQIEFTNAPLLNSVIEIITVSIGGLEILDYKEYNGDGSTFRFFTGANHNQTSNVYVSVNGVLTDASFTNSSDLGTEYSPNKTVVEFGTAPERLAKIKVICLAGNNDTDSSGLSVVSVNTNFFVTGDSTRNIDIDGFVNLSRGSAASSILVEKNGIYLRGVDTDQYIISDNFLTTVTSILGERQVYELPIGLDPEKSPGSILASNLTVFVNNQVVNFIENYVYDGVAKKIVFESNALSTGDIVRIENNLEAQYLVVDNNIQLSPNLDINDGDEILITWFSEYPSMDMISDEYVGGKVVYRLKNIPLNIDYVWVYKNGQRLTQNVDYIVTLPRSIVELTTQSTEDDLIKIVTFGSSTYKLPSAFEISKDMLNIYQYKRWSITDVELTVDLNYYDQQIYVNDATSLFEPIVSKNLPGVLYIGGERIEYFKKQGNLLSQLRRGSSGTPIGVNYPSGSKIIDVSANETIPYNENQHRTDFVSDGSTLIVGILDFIPTLSDRARWFSSYLYVDKGTFVLDNTYTQRNVVLYNGTYYVNKKLSKKVLPTDNKYWDPLTIPENFGPCDLIDVFVGGQRLRKDPILVYDEELSASSYDGDKIVEAEFSVDGISSSIRLTNPVTAGTRISVIRKQGNIWKDRVTDENTTDNIVKIQSAASLLDNNTTVAKFIAQKTTKLPE